MQNTGDTVKVGLAEALTFHASFDHGPDADFARGDSRIYSVILADRNETGELVPGLGQPALGIADARGRFGSALEFTPDNSHVVVFKASQNVAYSDSDFGGTASFWLSGDPAAIPGRYCDPLQVTDKDFSDACIWVDFTKNDAPPEFRLGFFGNQSEWDAAGQKAQSAEFYFRLLKVAEPPFARGQWTHVAIAWDGVNSPDSRPKRRKEIDTEFHTLAPRVQAGLRRSGSHHCLSRLALIFRHHRDHLVVTMRDDYAGHELRPRSIIPGRAQRRSGHG